MAGSWLSDDTMRVVKTALDGVSLRQQVISRNLSNVDTPGYRSQQVNFEDAVRQAMGRSSTLRMQATEQAHFSGGIGKTGFQVNERPGGSLRADQNDVDVDVELTQMSEAGIQYQALTQSASKKLLLLKAIATSR
jgi:flagellar basal-body rod protein FlgB